MNRHQFCISCGDVMPLVLTMAFTNTKPEAICEPCRVKWRDEYAALKARKAS